MHGELVSVNARIEQIAEFSVHADSTELIDWLATAKEQPTNVFVVHGEAGVAESFSDAVTQRLGWKSRAPKDGDSVVL
jgi:metallo-beta-lactamase family protein